MNTARCVVCFVVSLILLTIEANGWADEWRGFRGLELEGSSSTPARAVDWTSETNVRWKTPIPGEGHSSPVVSEDSVFLTSAFLTQTGHASKSVIRYSIYALILLIYQLTLVAMLRSLGKRSTVQLWSLMFTCFVMGVVITKLIGAQVYADEYDVWTTFSRWVLSGYVAALLLLLAGVTLIDRPWARLLIGLVAIGLSSVILLDRPEPEYYAIFDQDGGLAYFGTRVLSAAAIPAVVGSMLILAALVRWIRGPAKEIELNPRVGQHRVALRTVLLVAALVAGVLTPFYGVRLIDFLRTGNDMGGELAVTGKKHTFLAMCAFVSVGFLSLLCHQRVGSRRMATALGVGFLLAAMGVFLERNYVSVTNVFVRSIVCVDRATGEIKWTTNGLPGEQERIDKLNSQASPSAVFDEERVYAYFGSAGLMCTDHDGNLLWVNKEIPFGGIHGVAGSPIVSDGILVIVSEGGSESYIIGLDGSTGKQIWRQDWNSDLAAAGNYRTPLLKTIKGQKQVIFWTWNDLKSFDLRTGELVWQAEVEPELHEPVASPVSDEQHLYLATKGVVRGFSLPLCEQGQDPIIWETRGGGPETASPVRVNDLLFSVTDQGIAVCFDTTTGKKLWRKRLASGHYLASLIAAGEAVYAVADTGVTTVFAAERKFRKLAENRLEEDVYATPAAVDGQIFIRTTTNLYCIDRS